jgi:Trk K+ transport system NAD-binding subunit
VKEKKNVWLINQYTSTPLLGGGGNRSYHIAKELTKQDYQVTLITASYSHVPKRNFEVTKTFHFEQEEGIN